MFEVFLSEAQGVSRLEGAPDRAEIIHRYERASGAVVADIDYYELLACVVMSVINSRLGMLLVSDHGMSVARGGAFARRTIQMADHLVAKLRGQG
jgi:hypothetical protein